jgi:hypothetical protein
MDHVAKRKYLKKAAAHRLGVPENELGWVNGNLVFLSTNTPIEGVEAVPKPAKQPEPVRIVYARTPATQRRASRPGPSNYWNG